jgi:hypothetical protein
MGKRGQYFLHFPLVACVGAGPIVGEGLGTCELVV